MHDNGDVWKSNNNNNNNNNNNRFYHFLGFHSSFSFFFEHTAISKKVAPVIHDA